MNGHQAFRIVLYALATFIGVFFVWVGSLIAITAAIVTFQTSAVLSILILVALATVLLFIIRTGLRFIFGS